MSMSLYRSLAQVWRYYDDFEISDSPTTGFLE